MYRTKAPNGRNNIIGTKLYCFRKQRKLSQSKVADMMQLQGFEADRHAIRRIENGERFVTDIELLLMVKALNIPIYEFLG